MEFLPQFPQYDTVPFPFLLTSSLVVVEFPHLLLVKQLSKMTDRDLLKAYFPWFVSCIKDDVNRMVGWYAVDTICRLVREKIKQNEEQMHQTYWDNHVLIFFMAVRKGLRKALEIKSTEVLIASGVDIDQVRTLVSSSTVSSFAGWVFNAGESPIFLNQSHENHFYDLLDSTVTNDELANACLNFVKHSSGALKSSKARKGMGVGLKPSNALKKDIRKLLDFDKGEGYSQKARNAIESELGVDNEMLDILSGTLTSKKGFSVFCITHAQAYLFEVFFLI